MKRGNHTYLQSFLKVPDVVLLEEASQIGHGDNALVVTIPADEKRRSDAISNAAKRAQHGKKKKHTDGCASWEWNGSTLRGDSRLASTRYLGGGRGQGAAANQQNVEDDAPKQTSNVT